MNNPPKKSKTGPVDRQIGKNLRTLRKNAGLTQKDLGHILNVSFQQIQKYESGLNRLSPENLFLLKNYFNIPYGEFFKNIDLPQLPHSGQDNSAQKLRVSMVCNKINAVSDPSLQLKTLKIVDILTG